jgi:hypothetical protein
MARRTRANNRLGVQLAELSLAAPEVITRRVLQMARAGHRPSARDRAEMQRMASEKMVAFGAAWWSLAFDSALAWQRWLLQLVMRPWAWTSGAMPAWPAFNAAMLSRALQPIHRRATANVRRLRAARRP